MPMINLSPQSTTDDIQNQTCIYFFLLFFFRFLFKFIHLSKFSSKILTVFLTFLHPLNISDNSLIQIYSSVAHDHHTTSCSPPKCNAQRNFPNKLEFHHSLQNYSLVRSPPPRRILPLCVLIAIWALAVLTTSSRLSLLYIPFLFT